MMPTQTSLTSSNQVTPFLFDSNHVRVLVRDDEPWFIAADICEALGLANVTQAVSRLDDDEQALISNEGISRGNDMVNIVSESGMYSLVLSSRKPEAKRFKKWVTAEVLPAIRKTGVYTVRPSELSRMDILKLAMESEEARVKAEAERDEAIRTKALIGSRREASAMATASHAKRQVEALKQKLGESIHWATVKAVERATKESFPWKPLRDWCNAHEMDVRKVPDELYGYVNSYPAEAWQEVYSIDLSRTLAVA